MKQITFLLVALAAIFLLWDNIVLYPLKLLVVFFHEASHGLAALLTGGEIVEMEINHRQGGHLISRGGSRFIVASAGYLGSLAWGMACYLIAVKTRKDKVALLTLGLIIILTAVFYVRNLFGFGFSILTGGSLMFLGIKASEKINDAVLQIIGLTNMMYVPWDIFSDTIERSYLRSDARSIAEEYFGTTMMWGGLWFFISIFMIGAALWMSLEKDKKTGDPDEPG